MALKGDPEKKLPEVAQGTGLVLFFVGLLPKCGSTQTRNHTLMISRSRESFRYPRWVWKMIHPQTGVKSQRNWGIPCDVRTILKEERGQDMAWYWQCWGGTKARITFLQEVSGFSSPQTRWMLVIFSFLPDLFVQDCYTVMIYFSWSGWTNVLHHLGWLESLLIHFFFKTTSTHSTGQSLEPNRHSSPDFFPDVFWKTGGLFR